MTYSTHPATEIAEVVALPELPRAAGSLNWTPTSENALMPGYSADQMRAYALTALAQHSPATEGAVAAEHGNWYRAPDGDIYHDLGGPTDDGDRFMRCYANNERDWINASEFKTFTPIVMTPTPSASGQVPEGFDFAAHLARQREWSERTFGPGARTAGVTDHIRKELLEVEADPLDLKEWIDVVILALDGAWRCGATPEQIIAGIVAKQAKNEGRNWPDWRTADPTKAIEHER